MHIRCGALYCRKTLNICSSQTAISRFNENDILAYFDFDGYDTSWLQIKSKFEINL